MEKGSEMRGSNHTNRGKLAVLLTCLMCFLATPVLSQQLSTEDGNCGVQAHTVGPLEDSCTEAFGSTTTTRANYGDVGVYAESHSGSAIQGVAQFQDYLTISGGSGTSSVTVHWTLDGRLYAYDTFSTRFANVDLYGNEHALFDIHDEDPCGV